VNLKVRIITIGVFLHGTIINHRKFCFAHSDEVYILTFELWLYFKNRILLQKFLRQASRGGMRTGQPDMTKL
jgi:hypothetical protein